VLHPPAGSIVGGNGAAARLQEGLVTAVATVGTGAFNNEAGPQFRGVVPHPCSTGCRRPDLNTIAVRTVPGRRVGARRPPGDSFRSKSELG